MMCHSYPWERSGGSCIVRNTATRHDVQDGGALTTTTTCIAVAAAASAVAAAAVTTVLVAYFFILPLIREATYTIISTLGA